MRGPTPAQLLETLPPGLREATKTNQAYLRVREKILKGDLSADQLITPNEIEKEYRIANIGSQTVLMRLAIEGLVQILPVTERQGPRNNAALNQYRVANLTGRDRMLSTRHGDFVADITQGGNPTASKETLSLEVEYADEEVAGLLALAVGDPVIHHRNLQRRDAETIVCINDSYLPIWLVEMMPELRKPDSDIYQLMRQLGKHPTWCTEQVDAVQPGSIERVLFALSPDDPRTLFKILRRSFDADGTPLDVQFLTDRGDIYRLKYSFPLYKDRIPEAFRDK